MLVHDFAYSDIGFDGYQPPSILQVPGAKDVAVELYTLTKSFSMAGWRVAFMVGNPEIVAALTKLKSYLDYGTFQPIQIAAIVAMNEAPDYPKEVNEIYQSRRDALCDGLNRIGWQLAKPQGDDVRLGPHPRALPGDGVARVRQVPGQRGRGGDLARRRLRPGGRRLRALRPHRERAAHRPGRAQPPDRADETGVIGRPGTGLAGTDGAVSQVVSRRVGQYPPMASTVSPLVAGRRRPVDPTARRALPALDVASTRAPYLGQFDSYRVIACCAVVLQHSLLWNVAAGNTPAWALVMLLHFSRTAFFFLTAFVLTYSEIHRPRSLREFWGRRYLQIGVPFLVWTGIYWIFTMIDTNAWDQAGSLLWHDLVYGYYQLYFAVVLLQLYLVFPWLLRVAAQEHAPRRHHGGQLAVRVAPGRRPALHAVLRRRGERHPVDRLGLALGV